MSDMTQGAQAGTLAPFIDHTLLKPEAPASAYKQLMIEALQYQFFSVCIPPTYVSMAKRHLSQSSVKICTVVGFPYGFNTTSSKVFESKQAVDHGADEIDMVINVSALKSGDENLVRNDINSVVRAANGKIVKVILETCLLTDDEKVIACQICDVAGAHFVKTSTGFGAGGATLEDVRMLKRSIGSRMQVKASGGIRDAETARAMISAGASRLGTSHGVTIVGGAPPSQEANY